MNINLTLGAIVFLIWSTFSTWYYVCKIKGLCYESITEIETPIIEESSIQPEQAEEIIEEPKLEAIELMESKIYFIKNSTRFLDRTYVEKVTSDIKEQIEGRQVAINITGYTCDLGSASYNQQLGLNRAEAMRDYLKSINIGNSIFEVNSKGESEAKSGSEEQRQKDRKVIITVKSTDQ